MQAERGDGPKSYMEETPIHVGPRLICLPKTPWWAWGWTLLHPTCPLISIVGEHETPRHRQGLTEDHHLGTTGFRWSPWPRPDQSTTFQLAWGGFQGWAQGPIKVKDPPDGSKKYPVRLERRAESFASLETRPDSPGEFGMTLCDPIDGSPPGSPVPGILQARTLEWVAISSSNA